MRKSQVRSRWAVGPVTMLALVALAASGVVISQIVKTPRADLDKLVMSRPRLRVSQTLILADNYKRPLGYRADVARFRSEYGSHWRFLLDERTGRPNLVEGGAIQFIPGAANKLRWQDFAEQCDRASCIPSARMEALARDFLTHNRAALQINPEEFVLDPVGSVPVGNSIYLLRFQWKQGGVPVEGGSIFLAINNGNLIQIGFTNIGPFRLDPKPAIPVEKSWEVVRSYVHGITDRDEILNQGSLAIMPITPQGLNADATRVPFGKMIDYELVYKLAFRRPDVIGTWEALVDAHTGELVRFRDSNDYGHVQGGVYKTDKPQTEVTAAFPDADYAAGSYANTAGDFPGIAGTSTLNGLTAGSTGVAGGVKIIDGCGSVSQSSNSVGVIDFGNQAGVGTDCTAPATGGAGNTHAARTQYWNVNEIKEKGITYLPSNTWLQGQLIDSVNQPAWCNAAWDGTQLNFFKSTSCNNTGELPGVSLHEWGHGMDSNDGSGTGTDNRPIETRADWTALLQTHQSCTGSGFLSATNCGGYGDACTACTGVREADWAQHTHPTPWTPQNNGKTDPGYSCAAGGYNGPCGWEDHCESGIATQSLWDFVNRDLVGAPTSLDIVTAWQLEDRLFYTGMPQSTEMYACTGTTTKTSNGCGAGSLYTVMRAIDDDGDGTANGTPHAAAIFAALDRHGIACGLATDTTNQNQTSCPTLTTPTLTATPNNQQIALGWTSGGANATRYFTLRNETSCSAGFTRTATINAPTLTSNDTGLVHGSTYYYRVQAATANDSCVSPMSACVTATVQLPSDQDFYVRDWTDSPTSHDQGEQPSTNYSYNWAYSSDVWNRSLNDPGTPNASDWYPTDNMYAGTGTLGDNYGFTRISRDGSGSAASVTAEFLISPFGAGSNFTSVATTTVNFTATDQSVVQGAYYHQDPTTSTHACIAVQVSSPADPYLSPSLVGHSPGDPDGQSLILLDNNKAQRNLGVSLNVPHFAALHYALIHNPALFRQDMVLQFDSPARDKLEGAHIEIVGGKTTEFRPGGSIVLEGMQPGENRWIALNYQVATADPVPVHFLQLYQGRAVNAFTILAEPASIADLIRDHLRNHVQVFNRFSAALEIRGGRAEAEAAERLLRRENITPKEYLGFLKEHMNPMHRVVEEVIRKGAAGDAFGAQNALARLSGSVGNNQTEQSASEHGMLLNRLDAFSTMIQRAGGDPADIVQMVRWQKELYSNLPQLKALKPSHFVVEESQEFIEGYGSHKRGSDTYPQLMRELLKSFHETAEALEKDHVELKREVDAIEDHLTHVNALEKAHRLYLLKLQELAK